MKKIKDYIIENPSLYPGLSFFMIFGGQFIIGYIRENVISQALALVDRRLGKRTLEALKYNSDVHPLVMQFYELRCEVENIKPS
jgi:hypothetical protein